MLRHTGGASPEEASLFGHLKFARLNWKWQMNQNSLKVGANGEIDIETCSREITCGNMNRLEWSAGGPLVRTLRRASEVRNVERVR